MARPDIATRPQPRDSRYTICASEQCQFNFNGGNEVELDAITAVHADPAIYRIGSTILPDGGGGGVISGDHIPNGPGGRRVQMVMIHFEQSESVRGQAGNAKGSYNLFLNDGQGEGDANMRRVFRLEPDTAPDPRSGEMIEAFFLGEPHWESLVRQLLSRVGGAVVVASNKIVSPDGHLELDIQNADAPNLVAYRDGAAFWDAIGTLTRLDALEAANRDLTSRVAALEQALAQQP